MEEELICLGGELIQYSEKSLADHEDDSAIDFLSQQPPAPLPSEPSPMQVIIS